MKKLFPIAVLVLFFSCNETEPPIVEDTVKVRYWTVSQNSTITYLDAQGNEIVTDNYIIADNEFDTTFYMNHPVHARVEVNTISFDGLGSDVAYLFLDDTLYESKTIDSGYMVIEYIE
ncbi:MAG: hypothetical protein ACKVPJ_13415 [Chitinophagales bacterium]